MEKYSFPRHPWHSLETFSVEILVCIRVGFSLPASPSHPTSFLFSPFSFAIWTSRTESFILLSYDTLPTFACPWLCFNLFYFILLFCSIVDFYSRFPFLPLAAILRCYILAFIHIIEEYIVDSMYPSYFIYHFRLFLMPCYQKNNIINISMHKPWWVWLSEEYGQE